MSNNTIVNSTPLTTKLGIQDNSTRKLLLEPEALPSHCPKVWGYAQKGTGVPQLVVGNSRNQMFGDATFDPASKYFNHQTVVSNVFNKRGNAHMFQRIIPEDAGPKANYLLSLDVLATNIPQYVRDAQGEVMYSLATDLPLIDSDAPAVAGFKAKWVVTSVTSKTLGQTDAGLFGSANVTDGDQTDGAEQSTRYPIMQFWANSEGEVFNLSGHRLWAATVDSTGGANERMLLANKAFPYRLAAVRKPTETSSAKLVLTEDGVPYFDFTFKANQVNAETTEQLSLEDIYLSKYQTVESPIANDKFADLSGFKIYHENIATLLAQFYALEKTHLNASSDFTGAADEMHLFNFMTGRSSAGVPYYTYMVDTSAVNAARLTESSNVMAAGGSDGTMSLSLFAAKVAEEVAEYANPDSDLQDTARWPESVIYDTGFPMTTKLEMCKFISERKDTAVVLGTYVVGEVPLTPSGEHARAVALRTRLQNWPESDYFGTNTLRGVIIGRHGLLIDSQYKGRLPLTIEFADKAAALAGASDGKWKADELFDMAPNNKITLFRDISDVYTPPKQHIKDWAVGLNYPMSFTRKTSYFPALKTVYDNETSVLNSVFVMMICQELQKIGERTHRNFSGVVSLTNAQLIEKVNKDVLRQCNGRFAGLVQVVPNAFISDGDEARGYSWTLPIEAYFNNMKTAMALSLQVYRMSDYTAT